MSMEAKTDMSRYISRYSTKMNEYLKTDLIKYTIKGSLSLYLHYLSAIKPGGAEWSEDEKPNDIDIDVFYRDDPIMNSDNCTDRCRNVIKNIMRCFVELTDDMDTVVDQKIEIAYENRDNDTVLFEEGPIKIVMSFEKLSKRVMFGKAIDNPYSRIMIQYYDDNSDNFIDFFIDSVTDEEFQEVDRYIETIKYDGHEIDVLSFDDIIRRYTAMHANPSPDRIRKLPATRERFHKFFDNTDVSEDHRDKIRQLLELFDGLIQSGGADRYQMLYHINKARYCDIRSV